MIDGLEADGKLTAIDLIKRTLPSGGWARIADIAKAVRFVASEGRWFYDRRGHGY